MEAAAVRASGDAGNDLDVDRASGSFFPSRVGEIFVRSTMVRQH